MYKIYIVRNTVNGKIYVGQTSRSVDRRWKEHVRCSRNYPLSKAIRKYGEAAFEREEIDSTENRNLADLLERLYILMYYADDKGMGYNLAEGGEGMVPAPDVLARRNESIRSFWADSDNRRRHSERCKKARPHPPVTDETKNKMRLSRLGKKLSSEHKGKISAGFRKALVDNPEIRINMSAAKKGKKFSDEARANMSKARKGVSLSPEHREAISKAKFGAYLRSNITLDKIKPMLDQGMSLRAIGRYFNINHKALSTRIARG